VRISKDEKSILNPHPAYALVGAAAKARIDSHPHHTVYHAKRIIGRPFDDDSVKDLSKEVEFEIVNSGGEVLFRVPFHSDQNEGESTQSISIPPHRVGTYVVNHLMNIARSFLGHNNLNSAVIAVPAKFDQHQKLATIQAFKDAGVKIARVIEEPVAAALAYGLQKKANVDFILVYDFGGGTLDVSVLQVFDGGYVEVIGNDGDNNLGGADFDAAVARHLMETNENFGRNAVDAVNEALGRIQLILEGDEEYGDEDMEELLSRHCPKLALIPLCTLSSFHTMGEHTKIFLSSSNSEHAESTCFSLNRRSHHELKTLPEFCDALEETKFTLSRHDYESVCKDLFDKSVVPVNRLLTDLNLKVEEIDEVVMVGGTTKMPQIRDIIKSELGSAKMNVSIDPDLTVAFGAASVVD
jgi:molecular chaperone DnaK (HSP70)